MTQRLSEKEYQAQILDLAHTLGWIYIHPYDSRRSTPGFPDLVLVRAPRVIFAEIKRDGLVLSLAQEVWRGELMQCPGVEYYVWRPSDWDSVGEVLRP